MRIVAVFLPTPPDAVWNPIQSASAATTFSAFLSGIVLSAIVQIGISQAKLESNRSASLRFSAVSLVTLLTSTYMFVLLAGVRPTADDFLLQIPAIRRAGLLFGIGGSVLAVGAVLTLALILLVLRERNGQTHEDVASGAVTVMLTIGAVTAGTFLIFGYDDIYQLNANGADLPIFGRALMALLVYGPGLCLLNASKLSEEARERVIKIFQAATPPSRRPAMFASCWLFLLPALAFLSVAHIVDSPSSTQAITITATCAAWAGTSMAALLAVVRQAKLDDGNTPKPS